MEVFIWAKYLQMTVGAPVYWTLNPIRQSIEEKAFEDAKANPVSGKSIGVIANDELKDDTIFQLLNLALMLAIPISILIYILIYRKFIKS